MYYKKYRTVHHKQSQPFVKTRIKHFDKHANIAHWFAPEDETNPLATSYFACIVSEKPRGGGKTTLLGSLVARHLIPQQLDIDLKRCWTKIRELQAGGFEFDSENLESIKHTVYCINDSITSHKMGYASMTSIGLSYDNFGLYYKGSTVKHLLPGSIVAWPEIQKDINSRNWNDKDKKIPDHLLRLFDFQRKWGIRIIADTQNFGKFDKYLRELTDCIIYVKKFKHIKGDFLTPAKTTWDCIVFDSIAAYEEFQQTRNEGLGTTRTFTHSDDIFGVIDSNRGQEYFAHGLEKFHTERSVPSTANKADMEAWAERYPAFPQPKEEAA